MPYFQPTLFLLFSLLIDLSFAQNKKEIAVPEITVLGTSNKNSTLDFVPTVSELSGQRLRRKKKATLGETLAHETGISSSQFGPNASRPVIRGMDGDRIRILQNGLGVLDASAASQDHAVAIDPLVIDRIEVVRGPAALLYGSAAVGGVVNMGTTRIPEKWIEKTNGKTETRFSTVDQGRSIGVDVNSPVGSHIVLHFDGSARGADDYHVPGYARTHDLREREPLDPEDSGRVYNSFNRTSSQALGASYIFDQGFWGSSIANYGSQYGTVAERSVFIDMSQQRWDLTSEVKPGERFKSIRLRNSLSLYQHKEVENGIVGTTFKNQGDEFRVEAAHQNFGEYGGLIGLQINAFRFAALGDESFLPTTDNQTSSIFIFEERQQGLLRPSLGARLDSVRVQSQEDTKFGVAQSRSFSGGSFSLGLLYDFTNISSIVLNTSYTERAPNYQELFAQGRHVATAQNQVGDINLGKERSRSAEISYRLKNKESQGSFGLFLQDFNDYIALVPSGQDDGDPENPFQIYNYKAVKAHFWGWEMEFRQKLINFLSEGILEVEFKADRVQARNVTAEEFLPRIPPQRGSVALNYRTDDFSADFEIQHVERQGETAPNETSTNGYNLVNLGVEAPLRTEWAVLSISGRLNNAFDEVARNHVSVLKDLAPLPGRNLSLGLQASF